MDTNEADEIDRLGLSEEETRFLKGAKQQFIEEAAADKRRQERLAQPPDGEGMRDA